jgi:hypothetical protein
LKFLLFALCASTTLASLQTNLKRPTPHLKKKKPVNARKSAPTPQIKSNQIQRKDIKATLKLGVLTLDIDCGTPFEQDDEEEVPVAFE